jgi:hypothetical protein
VLKVSRIRQQNPEGKAELPASAMFRVEEIDKSNRKITLLRYREETKKIFCVFRKFCGLVEKMSCDEGFMDVTREVEFLYRSYKFDLKKPWHDSYFMGFTKEK